MFLLLRESRHAHVCLVEHGSVCFFMFSACSCMVFTKASI